MNNQQWSSDDHEKYWNLDGFECHLLTLDQNDHQQHWNLDDSECHLLTEPDSCLSELFHKYFLSFLALVDEDEDLCVQLLTNK